MCLKTNWTVIILPVLNYLKNVLTLPNLLSERIIWKAYVWKIVWTLTLQRWINHLLLPVLSCRRRPASEDIRQTQHTQGMSDYQLPHGWGYEVAPLSRHISSTATSCGCHAALLYREECVTANWGPCCYFRTIPGTILSYNATNFVLIRVFPINAVFNYIITLKCN